MWLKTATEGDRARIVEGALIPNGKCSVSQALIEVCLHSHGHRAQCATLLRRHGGVPPPMDAIRGVRRLLIDGGRNGSANSWRNEDAINGIKIGIRVRWNLREVTPNVTRLGTNAL
jgi:hypothetical protein